MRKNFSLLLVTSIFAFVTACQRTPPRNLASREAQEMLVKGLKPVRSKVKGRHGAVRAKRGERHIYPAGWHSGCRDPRICHPQPLSRNLVPTLELFDAARGKTVTVLGDFTRPNG
jgi:hypothetical protein